MDFITLDFEVANNNLNSACSIGLAFVKENKIVDKKHYYIQPPVLDFDSKMVNIHGITVDQVENELKFNEIWNEIHHNFQGDYTIVAHNAQFDMSVLHACLDEYDISFPNFNYIDSISISTKACRGHKVGNSLKERLDFFGLELNNHHNALADAIACAELVIASLKLKNRTSLKSYCNTYTSIPVRKFSELKPTKTFFGKKNFGRVKVSEISATVDTIEENHVFFGKNIVFTGELQTIDRKTAMQKTVNLGGVLKSGVSRKTNYLVVGKQDKSLVGNEGLSSKEKKAYELIDKGIDINILREDEFLKLL